MITKEEERYILDRAYVPEHSVGFMARLSGGDPCIIEDYLCLRRENWIIVVGYPLKKSFSAEDLETLIARIKGEFKPQRLSLMAPRLPLSFTESCLELEEDDYFTLDIKNIRMNNRLRRVIERAKERLTVERSRDFTKAHRDIIGEFIERVDLRPRIRNLFLMSQNCTGDDAHSTILNARDKKGNLTAFYLVDLAAKAFSTYVIGCHSKKNYTAGASDLLMSEMIDISREYDKDYIHLGIGVNKGIRQFKKKWGGIPTLRYEMGELVVEKPSLRGAIRDITRLVKAVK